MAIVAVPRPRGAGGPAGRPRVVAATVTPQGVQMPPFSPACFDAARPVSGREPDAGRFLLNFQGKARERENRGVRRPACPRFASVAPWIVETTSPPRGRGIALQISRTRGRLATNMPSIREPVLRRRRLSCTINRNGQMAMRDRSSLRAFVLSFVAGSGSLAARPAFAADPTGEWMVADRTARIRIEHCADG